MARIKELCSTEKGLVRSIGWKPDREPGNGVDAWEHVKYITHKFYLGYDQDKAEVANIRLQQFWKQVEDEWATRPMMTMKMKAPRAIWEPLTLAMGKAIAKGATTFEVPMERGQSALDYAEYLARLRQAFPVIGLTPEETKSYQTGTEQAQKKADVLRMQASRYDLVAGTGQTLHAALDDYIAHLASKESPDDSGWFRTQGNQAGRFKIHHADTDLGKIGLAEMQAMFDTWRLRKVKAERTGKGIAYNTAGNHVWQLKDFFNWLHKEAKYQWRRPADCWLDLDLKVKTTKEDGAAKSQTLQVAIYSPEELAVLYRFASPLMRCMILLALNCRMKQAELGTLLPSEVYLYQAHPHAKDIGIPSNPQDSFIKRIRPKTGVYGEFILWPETVKALEWAMERRQGINTDCPYLLVTSRGRGYAERTKANGEKKGGNKPSLVRNYWESLLDTIQAEHDKAFRRLPFSQLCKVASDLVRKVSDGEVSGVFQCHGKPVKTDSLSEIYANKPFAKVFEALKTVRYEKLSPMFAEEKQLVEA